jgi:TMEM175 potassium channel family protein
VNKTRLENLSDGVFAIVFTILVLDIRVPDALVHPSSLEVWRALSALSPVFLGYFVSFAVLTTFWIAHTFFFSETVKIVNRQLVLLNMLYLAFVTLLPFAAYLLGKYPDVQATVLLYGLNVFIIGALSCARFEYAFWSHEIDTSHNQKRQILQARVRMYSTTTVTLVGMLISYISISAALFLYAFPIVFNIIPGSLNAVEWLFGFRLGE